MGPWARAHGPMISAYFGLFGFISAYLETGSCLFQIIWKLILVYFRLINVEGRVRAAVVGLPSMGPYFRKLIIFSAK